MPIVSANDTSFDVDAVVFDKDGTLVDLDALWFPPARAWVETIAADDAELAAALASRLGVDLAGQRLVPDGVAAASTFEIIRSATVDELQARSWGPNRVDVALSAGGVASDAATTSEAAAVLTDIPALFRLLVAGGLRVGILTSADRTSTLVFLQQIGADDHVDVVVTATDVDHPKPHPQGLQQIADTLACPADRILMVGDSMFDHDAARAAGALFVAIGHHTAAAHGADASVDCVDQITAG
jgi:phosphoglycolate phosphatase-like HAD superfamily hydrolase